MKELFKFNKKLIQHISKYNLKLKLQILMKINLFRLKMKLF